MNKTENKPMSDLAKAILAGEHITSSTGMDKTSGVQVTGIKNVPQGVVVTRKDSTPINKR